MRGLGKTQKQTKEKMFWKVFGCISDINFDHLRYATINDIHKKTGINVESIRKHIVEGKKNIIKECKGYNNSRYFYTWEAKIEMEDHPTMQFDLLYNTENHINSLKFHNAKYKPRKERLKSSREIESKKSTKAHTK